MHAMQWCGAYCYLSSSEGQVVVYEKNEKGKGSLFVKQPS